MLGGVATAAFAARSRRSSRRRLLPTSWQSAASSAGVPSSSWTRCEGRREVVMAPTLLPTEWYPEAYPEVVFRGVSLLVAGSIATDHLMSFPGRFADSLVVDQLDKLSVSFLV